MERWNVDASPTRARMKDCVFHCSIVPHSEYQRDIKGLSLGFLGTALVPLFQTAKKRRDFSHLNKKGGEYGR
ncbi:hypothetical protein [Oricola cellulosilytica]|uniref:Uncharacterized protein n=1 Tax=Oricola cellulosilytica TaxID=1429082 RepID=A0A4R0PCZ2_9HYPH|nr:hypothetical protein [Oricola cellulosilytica]TCD15156.1 hypothetical protein E0D97_06300 [Oricola cellulosilytica]